MHVADASATADGLVDDYFFVLAAVSGAHPDRLFARQSRTELERIHAHRGEDTIRNFKHVKAARTFIDSCLQNDSPQDLLAEAERVTEMLQGSGSKRKLDALTAADVIEREGGINRFLSPELTHPGIAIPFQTLSTTLSGLRPAKFVLLGARPGVGKTAAADQIAVNAAAAGKTVLFVTLEMNARDVLHRAIATASRVSAYRFRGGRLNESERPCIENYPDRSERCHDLEL